CPRSARGSTRCSSTRTSSSTTSPPMPTTSWTVTTTPASSPRQSTWTGSSVMWWRPRTPWVLGSDKRINISFDEWNVWYLRELQADGMPREWTVGPRLSEDAYTVLDAVVVGSLLITLLRRSDRVHSACLAQLVNTISAIRTEPGGPAWRQSIFHPFALTAANARGDVLDPVVTAPTYETSSFGDVPVVDVAATHDAGTGRLAVFVVNRSPSEATELSLDVQGLEVIGLLSSALLADEDRSA